MKIWPNDLPHRLVADDYKEEPQHPNVEFPTEVGPPIERPLGTYTRTDISGSVVMTSAQVDLLADFVRRDLERATADFQFPHPRTGEMVPVRIRGRPAYKVSYHSPTTYRVSLSLMILDH